LTIPGFHRHFIALDPRHFLDVLVAGSVHYYQLKSEFEAAFPSLVVRSSDVGSVQERGSDIP